MKRNLLQLKYMRWKSIILRINVKVSVPESKVVSASLLAFEMLRRKNENLLYNLFSLVYLVVFTNFRHLLSVILLLRECIWNALPVSLGLPAFGDSGSPGYLLRRVVYSPLVSTLVTASRFLGKLS